MDEQQLKAVANSFKNLRATTTQTAAAPAQKAAEQKTAKPEQPSQSKRKSLAQRIADLEAREEQLKQQKRKLLSEQSRKERNARTKRFCNMGGAIQTIIGYDIDTDAKKDAFLDWLRAHWGK